MSKAKDLLSLFEYNKVDYKSHLIEETGDVFRVTDMRGEKPELLSTEFTSEEDAKKFVDGRVVEHTTHESGRVRNESDFDIDDALAKVAHEYVTTGGWGEDKPKEDHLLKMLLDAVDAWLKKYQ